MSYDTLKYNIDDTVENISPSAKFAKAQTNVITIFSGLRYILSIVGRRQVKGITLRLNTKCGLSPILEYSDEFINAINSKTLSVLLSIEMFRLLLHHPTIRMMADAQLTLLSSNIICTQNEILTYRLSDDIIGLFPTMRFIQELMPDFDLKKDAYIENIYAILNAHRPELLKYSSNISETPSSEDSQFESQYDALKKHFSLQGCISNTQEWGKNTTIDHQVERQTQKFSTNDWSQLPGNLREAILTVNARKIDVMAVIGCFARSIIKKSYRFNRMKVYRKMPELTGILPGHIFEQKSKVLFAIDSSGSMTQEEILQGIDLFRAALNDTECYYCFWDARCGDFIRCEEGIEQYDVTGGGGTNPQCVINKLKKDDAEFDGIVFISDCEFYFEEPDIDADVFIVETANQHAPEWCEHHLHMNDILESV